MSVITGEVEITNISSGVADVKLKFKIPTASDEIFVSDIPASGGICTKHFSINLPMVNNVTTEFVIRIRPILSYKLTEPLEYHIYNAKFDDINLQNKLNVTLSDKEVILGDFRKENNQVHEDQLHIENNITFYSLGDFRKENNQVQECHTESSISRYGPPSLNECPIYSHSLHNNYKSTVETSKDDENEWFYRYIDGRDKKRRPFEQTELDDFKDIFGKELADKRKDKKTSIDDIPFTLRDLRNKILDKIAPEEKTFVVADGGHLEWSEETDNINRKMRFIIIRQSSQTSQEKIGLNNLIFIVTGKAFDSIDDFLQIISWDNYNNAFYFYIRDKRTWLYLGNSWDAFKSDTRGKGPFGGHVNGSLVMKELNSPWLHWQSQSFTILNCLDISDPIRREPIFQNRKNAEQLQHIVEGAISYWNAARLKKCTHEKTFQVTKIDEFMRQILDNTTYNIISSDVQYSEVSSHEQLYLPSSFFINKYIIDQLDDIDPDIYPIVVDTNKYLKSIKKYNICLLNEGKVVEEGDGMFVFPVPEPAYEDNSLLPILLSRQEFNDKSLPPLLDEKFVLCIWMIDFYNPLDSRLRRQLLDYIPETANYNSNEDKYDLVDTIVQKIKTAAENLPNHTVEAKFLNYWEDNNLIKNCNDTINKYFKRIQNNMRTQEGVDNLIQLADSRRRMFRRRLLSEFDLTFPYSTSIRAGLSFLEMTPKGDICPTLLTKYQVDNYEREKKFDKWRTTEVKECKVKRFDPPAYLKDMDEDLLNKWHDKVSSWTDDAIKGYPDSYSFDGPRLQYYNPTKTITSKDAAKADIVWTAFPRKLMKKFVTDKERWEYADKHRNSQDEYCEWSVKRDGDGKITKVVFTCEGPEYWETLADNKKLLVKLYQEYVSPKVKEEELFKDDKYDVHNKWNDPPISDIDNGYIIHLTHKNNTLQQEIEIAGGSSIVRIIDRKLLTTEQELIKCGSYGDPDRFSDPHIGAQVNKFTRHAADVTILNPVAIYLNDLETSSFKTPDGTNPKLYWNFIRGNDKENLFVRAEYEVPSSSKFKVGDITIKGKPIKYGAQIADYLTMRIRAVACRFGQTTASPFTQARKEI